MIGFIVDGYRFFLVVKLLLNIYGLFLFEKLLKIRFKGVVFILYVFLIIVLK